MPQARLFLIDGHALCYRSFFAIRELTNSKGQATNAVYGFVNTLRKILREFEPEYLAVCFDSHEKTHREEKFAEYKIDRPSMPEGLISQIPIIKEVVEAFNVSSVELGGYEADDIIATLAKKAAKKGMEVVIVTDDKDMFQLANDKIKFYSLRKEDTVGHKELKKRLGFEPLLMTDFIGLAGDKVDNIPGVMGVGEVTARNLLTEYGSLESIMKNVKKVKPEKLQQKLIDQKDTAVLSKELAVLETDVPVNVKWPELKVGDPEGDRLYEMFKDLEFKRLSQEFASNDGVKDDFKHEVVKNKKDLDALLKGVKKKGELAFLVSDEGVALCSAKGDAISLSIDSFAQLKQVLEDKTVKKLTQNYKDVLKLCRQQNIALQGDVFDVKIAGYLLGVSRGANTVTDLAWNYFQKDVGDDNKALREVVLLSELRKAMSKELKEQSLDELYDRIERPLAEVLSQMESEGVKIDTTLLKKLSKDCEKKIDGLTKKLYKMAGEEFNLNSPKQLSVVLFEKLGLPVVKRTKTGYSTDEGVLTTLSLQHEFPALILEYRQLAKLKSTYIDALPNLIDKSTGRIHAEFDQTGAETGRLSSKNPNLQNIPIRTELGRQIRKAFVPLEASHLLLAADYSQVELRILAHLSQDKTLIKAFKDGQDIHNYTASLIFDVKEKDVTSDMRYATKRVNFGIIYGMSAFGLAKDLKIPQPEAQEFIDKYFLRYPDVKKFMDNAVKDCEKKGYAITLFNRRRHIPDINSRNQAVRQFAQRQAINTPVQGTAADLMKLAMIDIQKELQKKKLKSKMLITVHDELVFDIPKKEKAEMIKLVANVMENSIKLDVPIKVTVKTGTDWLDMKEEG